MKSVGKLGFQRKEKALLRFAKQSVHNNTKQGGDLWSLAKKVGDPKTSKHYSGMVTSIEDLAAPEGPNKRWRFGQVGVLLLLCATLT
jgi:hypothetical protein